MNVDFTGISHILWPGAIVHWKAANGQFIVFDEDQSQMDVEDDSDLFNLGAYWQVIDVRHRTTGCYVTMFNLADEQINDRNIWIFWVCDVGDQNEHFTCSIEPHNETSKQRSKQIIWNQTIHIHLASMHKLTSILIAKLHELKQLNKPDVKLAGAKPSGFCGNDFADSFFPKCLIQ